MQYLLSHVFLLCAILIWLRQGGLLKDAEAVDISGTTAVGSPQPWHFSEMDEAPGEGTVAGEAVLSSEGFISLQQYQAAESRDTQELEGYWQRRGRGKAHYPSAPKTVLPEGGHVLERKEDSHRG